MRIRLVYKDWRPDEVREIMTLELTTDQGDDIFILDDKSDTPVEHLRLKELCRIEIVCS